VLALIIGKEVKVPENPVISIVDDDLSVHEATTDLLRAIGFVVEAFPRTDDILASNLRNRTSCLIADMRMPGMSGPELYNLLVEAGPPVRPSALPPFQTTETWRAPCS
jgi:FixJ family two-component response regulator